jgi:hypothetical protein
MNSAISKPAALFPLLALTCLAAPTHAGAQASEEGAFALLVGSDTFAIETFSRLPQAVTGELVGRAVGRMTYTLSLAPDAGIQEMNLTYWGPGVDPDGPPVQAATLTVDGDTVVIQITTPPGVGEQRIASEPDAFLYLNPSFVMTEQMVRHARARGGDSVQFPVFMVQGGDTAPAIISSPASDNVRVTILGSPIQVVMLPSGGMASAGIPGQGLSVVRLPRR